jgi:hypothetical protein
MKTIADLKRALTVGVKVRTVSIYGVPKDTVRAVSKVQSNAVYLNGSMLDYPPASLCDFDGVNIKIYSEGHRDLTEAEKKIMSNEPSRRPENKERLQNEMLNDGSGLYWADKRYYKELNAEYLQGHDWTNGEKYDYNKQNVKSKKIKGDLILHYIIEK